MKKLFILALVLICAVSFAQQRVTSYKTTYGESIAITLDSTASKTIYVAFPHTLGPGTSYRTAIDTTALSSAHLMFAGDGDAYVAIVTDSVTAEESDSLTAWIQPYFYSGGKSAWYEADKDSTFLVFDTIGTYSAAAADYLDWADGTGYGCLLDDELWKCGGFTLTFYAVQNNTSGACTRLYVTIYFTY